MSCLYEKKSVTLHANQILMKFPHIEHRIYQSTFLRNVELQISYPRNKEFEGWMINAMAKWISNETKSKLTQNEDSLIVLSSNYLFVFKEDKCLCRFNPNHFKTFSDAVALLNENKELLIELFNNKVKGSRLKKTNIISAERTNDDSNDFNILFEIFSGNLTRKSESNSIFESSLLAQMTQTTLLQDDYELNINYGFSRNKKDPTKLMGVLELIAEDSKTCAYSNFIKNIERMNAIIFDMFNWCISQKILDLMKED